MIGTTRLQVLKQSQQLSSQTMSQVGPQHALMMQRGVCCGHTGKCHRLYLTKSRQDLAIGKQVNYEAGKTSRDHSAFSQGISNVADLVTTSKLHLLTACIHPVHGAVSGCLADIVSCKTYQALLRSACLKWFAHPVACMHVWYPCSLHGQCTAACAAYNSDPMQTMRQMGDTDLAVMWCCKACITWVPNWCISHQGPAQSMVSCSDVQGLTSQQA